MAPGSATRLFVKNIRRPSRLDAVDTSSQCLVPWLSRSISNSTARSAVQADTSTTNPTSSTSRLKPHAIISKRPIQGSTVLTTVHQWPTMEPLRFSEYSSQHLDLPLRRDLLHRAVIYEGDATRLGTASSKWRDDVRGSGRKVHQQKGTGLARAGDKKSPIRRGGGKAFGPHPRDFSTDLPRKIYDKAWRTALSYRWSRGELLIIDNTISIPYDATTHLLNNIFESNRWGKGYGGSTLVTLNPRPRLNSAMDDLAVHGVSKDIFNLDVKDTLKTGRIIIERFALDALLNAHCSDLGKSLSLNLAHRTAQQEFKQYWEQTRPAKLEVDMSEIEDTEDLEGTEAQEGLDEVEEAQLATQEQESVRR